MREDLLKEIRQLTAQASEETPSYSMHPADAATDSFDRDLVLGLASFDQEGLYEIDAALKRIDDGSYGTCELTGRQIPLERLEAVPWTRFTVEAERQVEASIHPHIGSLRRIQPMLHSGRDPYDGDLNEGRQEADEYQFEGN
jgi:RNA polymerase-binding transcription factor DksA